MIDDVVTVIERLMRAANARTDGELAKALGLRSPGAVANWRLRGQVSEKALNAAEDRLGVSRDWVRKGLGEMHIAQDPGDYRAAPQGERGGLQVADDPRLDAVLAWWAHWWATHDVDERTWALVQLRRAIPEADGWIRRWLQEHGEP